MSETAHNHPPLCCCPIPPGDMPLSEANPEYLCPLCPEHGELAQLAQPQPGECPVCHSEIGKQHTEYCRFTGTVSPLEPGPLTRGHLAAIYTQTSEPATHARTELDRASLDAVLTGNGYLLNGRRIPPEDVQIVHRGGSHWWEPTRDQTWGDRWHQDGPDSAHERTQCDPAMCGREPTPTAQDTPSPECPVCFGPRNQPPRPACSTPTAHDTPR